MLKIYLQIFGTIALCFIMLLNYQVFGQKPLRTKINESRAKIENLKTQNETLLSILEYKPHFATLEEVQFNDYAEANLFFARTFSEPQFMHRIQKMIDLSGCEVNGLIVGKVTPAKKMSNYEAFKTTPKDKLDDSVKAFLETMGKYAKDSKKWNEVSGPESRFAHRIMFYREMGAGKKTPMTMSGGFEIHRFNCTVRGSYNNVKKFLWLVSQNRPYTQVTVQSFVPINKAQGPAKIFACRVIILTYVDRNGPMQRTFTKEITPEEAVVATPEAKPTTTEGAVTEEPKKEAAEPKAETTAGVATKK